MKTFLQSLVLILSLLYSSSASAELQWENQPVFDQPSSKLEKCYIPMERLAFAEEGIFLQTENGQWASVQQLGYDKGGYYLVDFPRIPGWTNYIAECRVCRAQYFNRQPQPCEHCDKSGGFDIVSQSDYWDRD